MKTLQQLVDVLGQASNPLSGHEIHAPVVIVQMASGARYEGSVHEHTREMMILQGADGSKHYLDAVRVEAITILDCLALRDVLSNGDKAQPVGGDLRRVS